MGFVLSIIGAAVKMVLLVLMVVVIKSKLWAALLVYSLGWLIAPEWYSNQANQMMGALIGLGVTALLWIRPTIKKVKAQEELKEQDCEIDESELH